MELRGGINQVSLVGDRVHRPTGFWSPRVHDLLRHLDGFAGAPRFHGLTADGLEILDFLPGEVPDYPHPRAETALTSAAGLLRAYHDAVAEYAVRAPRDGWQVAAREPVEVICHNDFAPHNCVLRDGRVAGVIDFDYAAPGPRLWDVAFAAYRWVPMTAPGNTDGFGTPAEQASRLRLFCDRYGLSAAERSVLVDTVIARIRWLVDVMHADVATFGAHIADGHDRQYLGDAGYIGAQRAVFEEVL